MCAAIVSARHQRNPACAPLLDDIRRDVALDVFCGHAYSLCSALLSAPLCARPFRWIGRAPMPKNVVEKIARERECDDATRRQEAEAKERENSLKFNPNEFREFVSSFRKSKLRVRPLCEHLILVTPPWEMICL